LLSLLPLLLSLLALLLPLLSLLLALFFLLLALLFLLLALLPLGLLSFALPLATVLSQALLISLSVPLGFLVSAMSHSDRWESYNRWTISERRTKLLRCRPLIRGRVAERRPSDRYVWLVRKL
jgi:hypothetical protein